MKAYCLYPTPPDIRRAAHRRTWIDETPEKFGATCLPMMIGNEIGYTIHLEGEATAEWNGGPEIGDMVCTGEAMSHFGSGVVTFGVRCIFRTPPGIQLLVCGPTNLIKDGVQALTAVVETDWAVATFTMNWRMTRPGKVSWAVEEPFCQVIPIRLGMVKDMSLSVQPCPPELRAEYDAWSRKRSQWYPGAKRDLDYRRGQSPGEATAEAAGCPHFKRLGAARGNLGQEPA